MGAEVSDEIYLFPIGYETHRFWVNATSDGRNQ